MQRFFPGDQVVARGKLGTVQSVFSTANGVEYNVEAYGNGGVLFFVRPDEMKLALEVSTVSYEDIFGPGGVVAFEVPTPGGCGDDGCIVCHQLHQDRPGADDLQLDIDKIDARYDISEEIINERERQTEIGNDINDDLNSPAEWAGFISQYAGRALDEDFRENMIKVAALAMAAVEAYDA